MVLPDIFIDQATPEQMYTAAGMNASHIKDKLLSLLKLCSK